MRQVKVEQNTITRSIDNMPYNSDENDNDDNNDKLIFQF